MAMHLDIDSDDLEQTVIVEIIAKPLSKQTNEQQKIWNRAKERASFLSGVISYNGGNINEFEFQVNWERKKKTTKKILHSKLVEEMLRKMRVISIFPLVWTCKCNEKYECILPSIQSLSSGFKNNFSFECLWAHTHREGRRARNIWYADCECYWNGKIE